MQLQISQLTYSLLTTGLLTEAIDTVGTGKAYPSSPHADYSVTLPASVIKRLLGGRIKKERTVQEGLINVEVSSINRTHLGVLLLCGREYQRRGEVWHWLLEQGLSEHTMLQAVNQVRMQGYLRQLFSTPQRGRWYAKHVTLREQENS
jgi:hypothetical protein